MTQANWGLIDPNAFARGYQTSSGIVDGVANSFRQGAQDNALRTYAMNPNDPNAINALAQNGDPRLAMQLRERQAASQAAKHEKDTAMIAALARDSKDPETFDQAVDQVVAMGYPEAAQFKGKFSPGLRSALMAAGGIKDDAAESPYQAVAGQPGAGVYRFDKRNGTMTELVRANDGTGMAGAPVAPTVPPEKTIGIPRVTDASTYEAIPPGEQYQAPDGTIRTKPKVTNGGPTPPASGVFLP